LKRGVPENPPERIQVATAVAVARVETNVQWMPIARTLLEIARELQGRDHWPWSRGLKQTT
jgi:hypothetical protein